MVPLRSGLLACVPVSVPESAVLCPCPPRNDDGEGSGCGAERLRGFLVALNLLGCYLNCALKQSRGQEAAL